MPEPHVIIRGGTVVDEHGERRADVHVAGASIVAVGEDLDAPKGATIVDAGGCLVTPGFVDLHTHLREPGGEVAETVETGTRAAALGGYTAVVAMPNTEPAIDSVSVARDVLELGRTALAEVAVAAAITIGRRGEQLSPMADLAALGIHLFTDDGTGVQDAGLMRQALEYAGDLGIVLAQHCQDDSLAAGGHMHEGAWSSRLGITGQPALAEEAMLARDLALVRLTGSPMHFLHMSTAGSVEMIRRAKQEGLPVTAEVTPHHLALTDERVAGYDSVFKVNPPLRTEPDVEALRTALASQVIDAVATDHAPHSPERKEVAFDEAPPGMLGLETAFAVVLGAFGGFGAFGGIKATTTEEVPLSLVDLIGAFSWRPARIARLDRRAGGHQGGPIEPGAPANVTVIDPEHEWEVLAGRLASRSRNTPYSGWKLRGKVRHTIHEGELVVRDGMAER